MSAAHSSRLCLRRALPTYACGALIPLVPAARSSRLCLRRALSTCSCGALFPLVCAARSFHLCLRRAPPACACGAHFPCGLWRRAPPPVTISPRHLYHSIQIPAFSYLLLCMHFSDVRSSEIISKMIFLVSQTHKRIGSTRPNLFLYMHFWNNPIREQTF